MVLAFTSPQFLDFLMRKIAYDSPTVELTTAPYYLAEPRRYQKCEPSFSSWGYKGFAEVWLEGSNDWIYRHLHVCDAFWNSFAN